MKKKVSIIVPIYNVADYLTPCLNSVVHSASFASFEVILVNDGSTDKSSEICRTYASRYPNITLINKTNGGLSDARNAGMAVASGEWIFFLDSDDWLVPNAIEILLAYAETSGSDIVQGNFYYAFPDHNDADIDATLPNRVFLRQEAMKQLVCNDMIKNFAWGKLYKAAFVKHHLFDVGKYFEDSYWQYKIIDQCTRLGVVTQPLYYYRQREQSISGRFSIRNLDLLCGQLQRLSFIENHYPELTPYAFRTLWSVALQAKQCARGCSLDVQNAYNDFWQKEIVVGYGRYATDAWTTRDRVAYRLSVKHPRVYVLFDLVCRIVNSVIRNVSYKNN